jgi:hypothetical protein
VEVVLIVGVAVGLLWLVDRAGVRLSDGAVVVLVRGFAAWLGGKTDPWPSGVQEEDRDRPWGSERLALPTRVHSAVHGR